MNLMSAFNNSIKWKLILPAPILMLVAIILVWAILPDYMANNVREDSVRNAVQTVNQFKQIRSYYTKNVISKVVKDGNLHPSIDHKNDPQAVPLPATMIHDLSAALQKEKTSINLYSKFPFPNRKDRKLDSFQNKAWNFLSSEKGNIYTEVMKKNNHSIVRVAVADRMVADACVSCHNSHPDTPKNDWKLNDVRGILEVDINIDEQMAIQQTTTRNLILALIILGIILLVIILYVSNAVASPLLSMTNVMKDMSEGDLDVDIPGVGRKDEIGSMAGAVNVFKANAIEQLRLEKEAEESRIAQKEAERNRLNEEKQAEVRQRDHQRKLEEEAENKRFSDRKEMAQKFEDKIGHIMETVSSAATELNATSGSMNQSATSLKDESVSAASATNQAGENVQVVASAAEEMTASVNDISQQLGNASRASGNAMSSVNFATDRVNQMANSSNKISEIILLINDIAEQTNLLALNATIEAARAGDAGKGFAVVASEVKNLASQTATATDEIRKQINEMQESTQSAVSAVGEITTTIGELDEISSTIAAGMEQQTSAMQEISRNLLEAAHGTEAAGDNVKNVSGLAEETGNAASDVLNASDELSVQASTMKDAVEEFLQEIRSK